MPMFESMVSFTMLEHLWGSTFEPPLTPPGSDRHAKPERWPLATSDGFICVLPTSDKHWYGVFKAAEREDLRDDPRFVDRKTRMENRPFVNAELERIMAVTAADLQRVAQQYLRPDNRAVVFTEVSSAAEEE